MSAVVAVDVHCLHSRLSSLILDLGKTSVLPRIFSCICENNLITGNVETTVQLVIEIHSRWADGVIENVFAPLKPVIGSKKLRSHGDYRVGNLEPSKLGTNLPTPLSHVVIDVIGCISENIAVV